MLTSLSDRPIDWLTLRRLASAQLYNRRCLLADGCLLSATPLPSYSAQSDRLVYIALNLLPIHPAGLRRLLDTSQAPAEALARVCEQRPLPGLAPAWGAGDAPLSLASAAALGTEGMLAKAAAQADEAAAGGVVILTLADGVYPALLREIPDPPPALYVRGSLEPDDAVRVAVVGARRATRHGLGASRSLSQQLARLGVVIVSGLARGVDSEAHEGALEAGARTIAVLGSGLNRLYPPENRGLADRIAASGAVVSEYPLDLPPLPQFFPRRNRVISGLASATLVVEAGATSGALVSARFALEQGRELLAVPGSILGGACAGSNGLLSEGVAHFAGSPRDITRQLPTPARLRLGLPASAHDEVDDADGARALPSLEGDRSTRDLGPEAAALFAELTYADPVSLDELIPKLGLATPALLAAVARLETAGLARTLPGGRIVRKRPE